MEISVGDLKNAILDAYVSGESNTHKNAQTYFRESFLVRMGVLKDPIKLEVTESQDTDRCPFCKRYRESYHAKCGSCEKIF